MSLKSWMLEQVHRIGPLHERSDLPPRDGRESAHEPSLWRAETGAPPHAGHEPALPPLDHLGPYGALITSVRAALEHFIVEQLRLHLAIAERDRFLLTSLGVHCADDGQAHDLLTRFMQEFKPEQVKRYLAREVIAGLPNASALDLSQFAGLIDADATDDDHNEYRDLLVALRGDAPPPSASAYQVSVVGRWSELDPAAHGAATGAASAATPLAGQRSEWDVEDGDGRRRLVLQAVIPGRRYVVGKGEGADLRVNAAYVSRRHAELWLDKGRWWVADAGSTNGIRVESAGGGVERSGGAAGRGGAPLSLGDGARLVLSAQAEGSAADYPSLSLRGAAVAARLSSGGLATPIARGTATAGTAAAASATATPNTALTPILAAAEAAVIAPALAPRDAADALILTAQLASGERRLVLSAASLPLAIGRSRNQQLVIDRSHESVSGHHLDILAVDDRAADVRVHGDNGVVVGGVVHPAGALLRWALGETLILAPTLPGDVPCTLSLSRPAPQEK